MNKEVNRIIGLFNEEGVKKFAEKRGEDYRTYTPAQVKDILLTAPNPIKVGSVYKWPRKSGGKLLVIGFGLIELVGNIWFLAAFNSKKLGRPRVEKLYPEEVLKMIEHGEVEWLGSLFDKSFRDSFDSEQLSLAIMGFCSMVLTHQMNRNVDVEELLQDMEDGKVTMEDLLAKCRTFQNASELLPD